MSYEITNRNIESVRNNINKKIGSNPYIASNASILPVINDMDHHPYSRFFRGVYYYENPVIFEREAAWRPSQDNCYDVNIPIIQEEPLEHCFQNACSTVLPCFPEYLKKYSDKPLLDTLLNNACVVQYR
jgi:hypothetical protein